jgi:hypothetical protein
MDHERGPLSLVSAIEELLGVCYSFVVVYIYCMTLAARLVEQ